MTDLIEMFRGFFESRDDVVVAGNLLIYPKEGDPSVRFAPDVFVVLGVPAGRRRVWKTWKEGAAPDLVIEVSSRETWIEDQGNKKFLCAALGVREYILYDPEREYLNPPLQVYRLVEGEYEPVRPGTDGRVPSQVIDVDYGLGEGGLIELFDRSTGRRLLRPAEVRGARAAAEARASKAEDEVRRLRAELEALRRR
jgi:Uma2 family endonuclease